MSKKLLHLGKMDSVATAQEMARRMVQREARGSGDKANAMHRLSARYGVPYQLLWSLNYKPPKDILLSAWLRLLAAYTAECERQQRLLGLELERTRALTNATDLPVLDAAQALVDSEGGQGR